MGYRTNLTDGDTIITNNRVCPVCGSDVKRDPEENIHDEYVYHGICCKCGITVTFHN